MMAQAAPTPQTELKDFFSAAEARTDRWRESPIRRGFPIMVPGQVITAETISFMRKLDVKEIQWLPRGAGSEGAAP